ncbi:hypothetical protein ROU88_04755 [Macrococcus capreoli]|uniref:hypothetical protein n=1 Tax=Macrococcus capreoli TaxID=2982690 RepID=UPI003EE5C014
MKKLILLLSTGILLTACGPSETEQLTQEKSDLKKEIKNLSNQLDNEKTKNVSKNNTLKSLEGDLKHTTGDKMITSDEYTQHFKSYVSDIGIAFQSYADIENKLVDFNNQEVGSKLSDVKQRIKDAVHTYDAHFKKASPPIAFEPIHKQIESANKMSQDAIEKIESGYDKKDEKLVKEGQASMQQAIDQLKTLNTQ